MKIDAELGSPDLTLYFEHELAGDRPLLDLRVDAKLPYGWHTRVGQYKIFYNRERVDFSAKQTIVLRSIATYAFTLDRQRGITIAKQWGKESRANQWVYAGAFAGNGREPGARGDGHLYMLRWQGMARSPARSVPSRDRCASRRSRLAGYASRPHATGTHPRCQSVLGRPQ